MKNLISLEEFLKLRIKFVVEPYYDEECDEKGFIITSNELPGIKVFGESYVEALEEFEEAKIAWYEMKVSLGEDIQVSEPNIHRPSGRLTARFPVILHEKIIRFAEENQTTVNSAINQLINFGFERVNYNNLENVINDLAKKVNDKNLEIEFVGTEMMDTYNTSYWNRVSSHSLRHNRNIGIEFKQVSRKFDEVSVLGGEQ